MHVTVKFTGKLEDILEEAVKEGLVQTKTEALRLGIIELNNHYNLLQRAEEELLASKMKRIENEIRSGKVNLLSLEELKRKHPELKELE